MVQRTHGFLLLYSCWLKHRLARLWRPGAHGASRRREHVYVDASFAVGADGRHGVGGIGVWLPGRRIAIALKVKVKTSMEAEILALAAGALAAKQLKVRRPVLFSDCKSAVRTASQFMSVPQARGMSRQIGKLLALSDKHRAFRHVYDAMHSLSGSLHWQPREANREADLASNIGSRIGNMGILLSQRKNRNHALNDVLSLALDSNPDSRLMGGLVHRRYRCGTRTVCIPKAGMASSRTFVRHANRLIKKLAAEVA